MPPRSVVLAVASLAFAVACGDKDPTGTTGNASVQFVNASSSGTVTPAMGGQTLGTSLAFQQSSTTCQVIPAGTQTLAFASSNTTVATIAATNFEAGRRYTVVLQGTGSSRSAVVLPDNFTSPGTGNYAIRFVNASNQTGNIHVTSATGQLGTPAVTAIAAGNAISGYMTFPTTNTRVRFMGASTTPMADITLTNPPPSAGATVIFTNDAVGGIIAFVVNPCT
jgi:hypothetical protein